jgi:hypothetical protein
LILSDLNAIPPDVLEQARRLDGEERHRFLLASATPVNRAFLRHFIRDVVDGGADPATWGYGKVLLPDLSLSALLASSAEGVARSLGRPGEGGWLRVATDPPEDPSDRYVGAPAVPRPELKYLWRPPHGVTARPLRMASRLRPVADMAVAVRRWMAYRAALVAGPRWERLVEPGRIAGTLGIDPGDVSPDGAKALAALAAEAEMGGDTPAPPGFRGADSLYA